MALGDTALMPNRQINAAGLALVQEFEGLHLTAYDDGSGTLTIGWGHTGPDVHRGQVITREQALQLLTADMAHAADFVQSVAPKATDNEFAAMTSLAFNEGTGALKTSTVLRLFLAGDKLGAAKAFMLWDKMHIDGQLVEVDGLLRRRFTEAALFLTR